MSAALYASVKSDRLAKVPVLQTLYNDCTFLSSLLKSEFVYGPQGFNNNFDATLDELCKANVITVLDVPTSAGGESVENLRVAMLSDEERRIGRENFGMSSFDHWVFLAMLIINKTFMLFC
jgi:hypothetical protein